MKILMLATAPGADDGFTVLEYEKGREYEVGDALARTFIEGGQAETVPLSDAGDGLDKHTVADLKALAEAEKVEIAADLKKAEIIEAIRAARAAG